MCFGGKGSGGGGSVQQVKAPTVAATPPPPEDVAEAPVVNEGQKRKTANESRRRGTSALRIGLTLGGGDMGGGNGSSGVSIPR